MKLSLLAVAASLCMVGALWWMMLRRGAQDTGGGDPIGGFLAHWRSGADDIVYVWIAWTLICLIVVFGGGYLAERRFFLEPVQLLMALNYVFVVPVLVAAYIFLLRAIGRFPQSDPVNVARSRREKLLRYALILIATGAILSSAVQSELDSPSPSSPWVKDCRSSVGLRGPCKDLSISGAAFYVMRGIDTSMALGLTTAVALAFHKRRQRFSSRKLVDYDFPGLGPTKPLTNLGTALLIVASVGSIVTFLHGASLFIQAQDAMAAATATKLGASSTYSVIENIVSTSQRANEDVPNVIVDLFIKSTWLIWLVLTFVSSVLSVVTVLWLRESVASELRRMQRKEAALHFGADGAMAINTDSEAYRLEIAKNRLEVEARLAEKFDKARTWPLPMGAGLAFLGAAVLQIGNVLFGLYSFFAARELATTKAAFYLSLDIPYM